MPPNMNRRPSLVESLLIGFLRLLLRGYQLSLSYFIGRRCRFDPSCSAYSREALAQHGLRKGVSLSWNRIRRCHPWQAGGYDPVPPAPSSSTIPHSPHSKVDKSRLPRYKQQEESLNKSKGPNHHDIV